MLLKNYNVQLSQSHSTLVRETAEQLLSLATPRSETLIALAHRAEIKTYSKGKAITEAGDTCRVLLLLIEGSANIHYQTTEGTRIERLRLGQTLNELEVLAHSSSENTILADRGKNAL
jgi:signal-transduction protein with cAMP-binding, CBS, and nucleotidyltransferase domain